MNEIKQLESLHESIQNEIDELQSLLEKSDNMLLKAKRATFQKQLKNIIDNLESSNDAVYGVYEDLNGDDIEQLLEDYNVLYEVLEEKLTYAEKIDMRIKHGIDFWCSATV